MRAGTTAAILVLSLTIGIRACGQESHGVASRPESRPATRRFEPRATGTPELLVRLERKPCYGMCPVYSLTVTDDGRVAYVGDKHVEIPGPGASWLDSDRFDRLVRAIIEVRFEELEDRYVYQEWTDHPTTMVEINLDGKSKKIEHYHGDKFAPRSLERFEDLVDDLVGSDAWVLTLTQREEVLRRRRERDRAATRPELSPAALQFLNEQFADTANLNAFAVVEDVGSSGTAVTLRLDPGKLAKVGSKLILIHDRAYGARLRVTAVERGIPRAIIEHLEPGVSIAPGDLVWDRAP